MAENTSNITPTIVSTKKALGKALGVTAATAGGWIKKGMPVMEDGRYDVEAVREWHDKRIVEMVNKNYPVERAVTSKDFREKRADYYLEDQAKNIRIQRIIREEALTRAKIREMADQHLIAWFDKLGLDSGRKFEQERLELDKSTDNVAVIVQTIKEAKQRRNAKTKEEAVRPEQ